MFRTRFMQYVACIVVCKYSTHMEDPDDYMSKMLLWVLYPIMQCTQYDKITFILIVVEEQYAILVCRCAPCMFFDL